jgi:hypothetical protein
LINATSFLYKEGRDRASPPGDLNACGLLGLGGWRPPSSLSEEKARGAQAYLELTRQMPGVPAWMPDTFQDDGWALVAA